MKFRPALPLLETPPPDPLEAAVTEADRLLEAARRDAESAASSVREAEARRRQAASDLDAERVRVRAEEERKTVLERVQPLVDEVTQLDTAIREALLWTRAAIERRARLSDRAERLATANFARSFPPGIPRPGPLDLPRLRADGARCQTVELTLEYSLGDPRAAAVGNVV